MPERQMRLASHSCTFCSMCSKSSLKKFCINLQSEIIQ
ncbi:MAG: DUF1272 domain-containing protein [Bacteroidota bacterium]|nr:DUF1272 domain-containing protein [Bacteroidota bacterium]